MRSLRGQVTDDLLTLAEQTVASVRADCDAIARLCQATERSERSVRKLLRETHGGKRIKTLFRLDPRFQASIDRALSRSGRARVVPGQGGVVHRTLQDALYKVGEMRDRCYACFTDRGYCIDGIMRKPDVSWHRSADLSHPFLVFEIELGSKADLAKSWETLEKFHGTWNCVVVMVTWRATLELAQQLQPLYLRQVITVQILCAEDLSEALETHGLYGVSQYLRKYLPIT